MGTAREFTAVGVDGCKGGWFYVAITPDGDFRSGVVDDLPELIDNDEPQRILVDIPIGLPLGPEGRQCDLEARQRLGSLKSAVFPVPIRAILEAEAYADAKFRSVELTGKAIPTQTWAIVPKIKQLEELLQSRGKAILSEVHPELCFWGLNNETPLRFSKKTHNGFWERLGLLEMACTGVADALRKLDTRVAVDDVLDATAAALTATADPAALRSLPAKPQEDAHGLPMQLLYTTREHVRGGPDR